MTKNIFEETYRGIQEAKKAYEAASNIAARLKPLGFSRRQDAPWQASSRSTTSIKPSERTNTKQHTVTFSEFKEAWHEQRLDAGRIASRKYDNAKNGRIRLRGIL